MVKILVVDDNPDDRYSYRRFLGEGSDSVFSFAECESGEDGLKAFQDAPPDCVLLDFGLPDMDGIEFLRRVAQIQPGEPMPIVILTGKGNETIAVQALKIGAQDYLSKNDLSPDTLRRAVENTVEKVSLIRKVDSRNAELVTANHELQATRDSLEAQVLVRTRELEAARLAAEEANRLKDEFLATLSHELRTPLSAILGWSTLLRGGSLPEESRKKAYEVIHRNAQAQAQLIEDLLQISQIIAGKLQLEASAIEPGQVVELAIESLRPEADAGGIRLELFIAPDLGHITADPARLQQIVWNLFSNAVRFTPRGKYIRIRAERAGPDFQIVVADEGKGIPPDFLPHVFDRFRQADNSRTRSKGGLGLGLAIVRYFVELHGGSIEARSDGVDQGATFIVRIPLRSELIPRIRGPRGTARPVSLKGMRILVVDDDADILSIINTVLSQNGATVRCAASAEDAMHAVKDWSPAVVISDIAMPRVDGYAFIRTLRESGNGANGSIPAIALTAFAGSEDKERALAAGYQVHISKPIDPMELCAVVASLFPTIDGPKKS